MFVALLTGVVGHTQSAPARVALGDFFKPGVVFQDRNSDGVVDYANARLVLSPQATAGERAAAADIAARLGFETSALDLPLAKSNAESPTIFVGVKSLGESGTTVDALAAGAPLKAGDGLIAAFSAAGQPALAVLGGDDGGLSAAAVMLAGHLPLVWDQKGPTTDKVADEVKEFLGTKGITANAAAATAAFVRANTDGAERLVVDLQLASGDVIKAQVALNQMVAIGSRDAKRPLSYANIRFFACVCAARGSAVSSVDIPRAVGAATADAAPTPPPARRPGGGAKDNFDLSTFYANDGALADSDNNLIPDRVDVLLTADGDGTDGIVDLAARLGLESTGIALPIAKPPKSIAAAESEPILVIIGVSHPLLDQLSEAHKWDKPALAPGEGLIQVVKKAFGEKAALIVTGGDAAGVERAVSQLAERLPHIWARGKDRTTLDDVEDDLRKFIAGRSPAGQAAMALYKIDQLGEQLRGKDLASARVRVYVEKADERLAEVIKTRASSSIAAASLDVAVQNLDVQKGKPLVTDDVAIPSEVDDLWVKLRKSVVPGLKPKKRVPVTIEARVSEPLEVRKRVEQEVRAELVKAGADDKTTTITILSAYKQGYHWLSEVIRPALAGKPVDRMTIKFAEIGPPAGWKQQGMFVPTRWLLELYPIDEILATELKLDRRKITFEMMPIGSPAYEVVAQARDGSELLKRTFEPKVVERPFFDRFPDYERVRVTTGWFKAEVAGRTVADERIATDPERFWDYFQSKTLPALYDHVMALGRGKPRAEDAPFFGELNVDLTLSEPEYRLPIDQEQISSMEALHEEIYFNTLHFFDVMGRFTRGAGLAYPGRVIPVMHPKADGTGGRARISVSGFDAPHPSVVVEYVERSGRRGELRLDVPKIAVERPQALAAAVRAGKDGIARLDLRVKVDTERDEREALIARAAEERVDRTMISAEQVNAAIVNLGQLRAAGLYRSALAYHDLGGLKVTVGWEHEPKPATDIVATIEGNGDPAAWPDIATYRVADSTRSGSSGPFVQWDTPIPPPEAYAILAKMSAFKEATVYKVGESYLGKDVWAMDLMPPVAASHWSQAKQTTLKPTIVYSARQHANEVSSTSHVLRMAELLLTDPAYREKLNKVNVVIHPITNADGAQLAYDLQKINPTYMLHAGYLGALGVDVTSAQWDADPIYPESGIRPKIWRTWLPDIFLNPHGYPSHEWVQLFSEYAAWVRTRAVETRDYWTMRGWWMPGFAWLDDPRYPRHKDEQMKLLQMITQYARASADTVALNERAYDRYKRYSFDFDQKNFKLDFTNGVLIYKSIKGARANPQSNDFMARNPNVTIWEGVTEAPDETARGDWMKLVANAGLQWDKAILDYLVQGRHEVERKVDPFWNGVSLSMNRPRPPKPPKADAEKPTTAEQVR
jgi:hypothetical protein